MEIHDCRDVADCPKALFVFKGYLLCFYIFLNCNVIASNTSEKRNFHVGFAMFTSYLAMHNS